MKSNKVDQYQDIVTNKVLTMFGGTVVFLWGISYLSRAFDYTKSYKTALTVSVILMVVGACAAVLGLAWQAQLSKKSKSAEKPVYGLLTSWFGVAMAVSAAMMRYVDYTLTMRVLYIVMPVAAVLFLVYHTYQREFFTLCLTQSLASFALWTIAKSDNQSMMAIMALIVGLLVCSLALLTYAATKKKGGVLAIGNFKLAAFGAKTSAKLICATYIITAILLVAAFVLGAPYAYYIMFTVLGCLFVAAIYYTVAMM